MPFRRPCGCSWFPLFSFKRSWNWQRWSKPRLSEVASYRQEDAARSWVNHSCKFGHSNPKKKKKVLFSLDTQSCQGDVKKQNMTVWMWPRCGHCPNCATRNTNAWKCMSGETPMSAFRASSLPYDSCWREFPRKRQMPSAQDQQINALPLRSRSGAVRDPKRCVTIRRKLSPTSV